MDTFTQVVLGSTIAEAGFREKLGTKAVVFGGVCGLLPDLDLCTRLAGQWQYFDGHRGITHSLFFLAAITPLLGYAGYRIFGQKQHYLSWCHLAFWALLTHPILDLFTSYGTRLFLPLTDRKFAIDAIAAVDLFYTIPLVVALIVGSRKKLSFSFRKFFAIAILLLTSGYIALGYTQGLKAKQLAEMQLQQEGVRISRIRCTPTTFTVFLWRVIAQDQQGNYKIGIVSTLCPQPIQFHDIQNSHDPLAEQVLETPQGKIFRHFSMNLMSIQVERLSETRVSLRDLKYGPVCDPTQAIFAACFTFDAKGNLQKADILPTPKIDLPQEIVCLWEHLWGKTQ